MRDRKHVGQDGREDEKDLGETEEGEAVIRLYLVIKNLFSIIGKMCL